MGQLSTTYDVHEPTCIKKFGLTLETIIYMPPKAASYEFSPSFHLVSVHRF